MNRRGQAQMDFNVLEAAKRRKCYAAIATNAIVKMLFLIAKTSLSQHMPAIENVVCFVAYILATYSVYKGAKCYLQPVYVCECVSALYSTSRVIEWSVLLLLLQCFELSFTLTYVSNGWLSFVCALFGYLYVHTNVTLTLRLYVVLVDNAPSNRRPPEPDAS